jgi:hypothetical protein
MKCILTDDHLTDELGTISLSDLPDRQPECKSRLSKPTPLIEKLWRCALFDAESNRVKRAEGSYFTAGGRGKGWKGIIFTRDLGYASILGLGHLFPKEMRESLRVDREVRLRLGLRADPEHVPPGLPFVREDVSQEEFVTRHGTNPYTRRTDDVLWLWWMEDLLHRHGASSGDWEWVYTTGCQCFKELYDPFFDAKDGLYMGQSSFIDVGYNGYPESFGRKCPEAYGNSIRIKAASTNCLYYRGMQVMAKAAEKTGRQSEAEEWVRRADGIRSAIRSQLILPDGRVSYFKHEGGFLEQREHCLGTAFAILLGVLEGADAVAAISGYPVPWWGVPLLEPDYPNSQTYHNSSTWPFATAFFLRARELALGTDEAERELAMVARSCRHDTFHEWASAFDKRFHGEPAQLWTLGAFIGRCIAHYGLERE